MRFKIQGLLTPLIGLFLFASCKDTNTIGFDLDPSTEILGTLIDSTTVNSTTQREVASETNMINRSPLGYMTDPVFGQTEASIALTVNFPTNAKFDFGTNAVLDSAVLVLSYSSQFYGDTATSNYSFDVKQLTSAIHLDENFPSSRVYPTEAALLGSYTGKIYPTRNFKITDIVPGKPDTLKLVNAQLRIPLDKNFIKANIIDLGFGNNAAFLNNFRGLKISLNKAASSGPLGIAFFDFSSVNSNLELYYKKTANNVTDTVVTNLPINFNRSPVASTVSHVYAGTPVQTQLDNPSVQYATTYIHGLGGVRTKLSFPHLNKISQSLGKVIVNKAELSISLSSGTNVAPFLAAPRLALYRDDIAGRRQQLRDRPFFQSMFGNEVLGDGAFGGYFNSVKGQYVFVVTNYIQDLLDGKYQDYGTYLSTTPSTEFDYLLSTMSNASRSVIGSGAKNASGTFINPNNRIKLNIYYTKI